MMLGNKKPQNMAGLMGGNAPQPMFKKMNETTNPLEQLMQKVSGKTQGRAMAGIKPMRSIMNGGKTYG